MCVCCRLIGLGSCKPSVPSLYPVSFCFTSMLCNRHCTAGKRMWLHGLFLGSMLPTDCWPSPSRQLLCSLQPGLKEHLILVVCNEQHHICWALQAYKHASCSRHCKPSHVCVCLQVKDEEQEAAKFDAVFPCILRILPNCVFNKKDPIVVGVDIEEGIAKVRLGTTCDHSQKHSSLQ